jgi:hypothetical protein
MLIIGDEAISQLKKNNHIINNVEIIATQDQHVYIRNLLNIYETNGKISHYGESFPLRSNKNIILYNANNSLYLLELLEENFASKLEFNYASPKILYCIELNKITERHKNVLDWEKSVNNYNFLLNRYILPIKKFKTDILKKLEMDSLQLYPFVSSSNLIEDNIFNFRKFDIYYEYSLHRVFALNKGNNFLDIACLYNKKSIIENKWRLCNFQQQINIILERIYVIAINEFVIPYWLIYKKNPINVENIIKKTIMILACEMEDDNIQMFIIYNYNYILTNINYSFLNIFNNSVKFGDIEEVK